MTPVVLLPDAEDELADAAEFLEQRVLGLGERLTAEVEHALGRLAENPHVGPDLGGGMRKLRTRRFPYNLIYRTEPARVLVLAVAHQRRRPEYWRGRG